ncbi:hypothetical protein SLEP1_g28300 [Rubroshorea leprosula]|uniref:HMA domain-containing protein n=1 Tax=Rubroshorea leprosula TaxID=152421 RepID=A0AAV5JT77_9ROSI|nr:hypothetical protein SLEP1_g28300 [Rubroshorea leprosula]
MEHQREASGTFIFKVNHKSCSGSHCQERTTEELKRIHGVDSVSFDAKGLVKVSGNLDSKRIVGMFDEWGKEAELLSFRKDLGFQSSQGVCTCAKKCNTDSSFEDDSDDDRKNTKKDVQIPMENPDSPGEKQSMKKSRNFFGFLGCLFPKKNGATKMNPKPKPMIKGPLRWRHPLLYMSESQRYSPYELYPPVQGRGLAPPYYQPWLMRPPLPPPLPPYGRFNYRTPGKPNPMIHFSSYADNYSYW